MRILVEGRIQTGSYEKDGRKVYTTDIVVENHYFCESKREEKPADPVDDFMTKIPEDIIDEMPFGRKGAEE
jgi:single-strand DNA-binding protein